MKKIIKKYSFLVGVFIFIWILKDMNFIQIKESFLSINPFFYAIAVFLYIPVILFKALRWKTIMDTQGIHYSFNNAFLMYGASYLLALVTPGRLGEFSRAAYLKKDNYSTGQVFLGNLLDKVFDVLFVIVFALIAFVFLPFVPRFDINYLEVGKWAFLGMLTLGLAFFVFYSLNKEKFYGFFKEVLADMRKFGLIKIFLLFAITAGSWMSFFTIVYFIGASIGIAKIVGFLYLAFSLAVVNAIGFLPISVLNIGPRELVLVFLLTPLGLSKELVISFSFLILINYLSLFSICFLCWLKKPVI